MISLKFCPSCGKKTFESKNNTLLECKNCNFRWFVNPKPTTNVIFLDKNNQILLAKRKFEPKSSLWGLVGGFVDTQETVEKALIREIEEETSLKITRERLQYFCSKTDDYDFENLQYKTLSIVFCCVLSSTEITNLKPNDDVFEFKFFEKENIPYSQIAFESTKQLLLDYFVGIENTKTQVKTDFLEQIRQKIDLTDQQILYKLSYRKLLEKMVAEYKKFNKLQIIQPNRYFEIQKKLINLAKEHNLSTNFVLNIWEIIHQDSVQFQTKFLEKIRNNKHK
jgi:NAD+ diphosphatase